MTSVLFAWRGNRLLPQSNHATLGSGCSWRASCYCAPLGVAEQIDRSNSQTSSSMRGSLCRPGSDWWRRSKVSIHASSLIWELQQRAEAVPLAGSSGCRRRGDGCFYPRKEAKPNFAFNMVHRHKPLHQAILVYCETHVSSIYVPIGFCRETNPVAGSSASISSFHHARPSTPRRPAFSPVGQIRTATQSFGRQKRYVDNLIEVIVRMAGTFGGARPVGNPQEFATRSLQN